MKWGYRPGFWFRAMLCCECDQVISPIGRCKGICPHCGYDSGKTWDCEAYERVVRWWCKQWWRFWGPQAILEIKDADA